MLLFVVTLYGDTRPYNFAFCFSPCLFVLSYAAQKPQNYSHCDPMPRGNYLFSCCSHLTNPLSLVKTRHSRPRHPPRHPQLPPVPPPIHPLRPLRITLNPPLHPPRLRPRPKHHHQTRGHPVHPLRVHRNIRDEDGGRAKELRG